MNNIIENFKHVVFENYATFTGRARRSEYWYFILATWIISFLLGIVSGLLGVEGASLSAVFYLLILVPLVAVTVRRVHDSDRSGWWSLLPLYNWYLVIKKGSAGTNRFGPDPLAPLAPIPPATPPEGQTT